MTPEDIIRKRIYRLKNSSDPMAMFAVGVLIDLLSEIILEKENK